MDIVVCTDGNYVMPTGIMLYSVCKNNVGVELSFYVIIDKSVSQQNQLLLKESVKRCSDNAKIEFYLIERENLSDLPRLDNTNTKKYITRACYYRLFLTEILPTDINKILYLDVDVIVKSSLKELWESDLDNMSIGVVPDASEGLLDKYYRLRYPQTNGYFNSGVLLINLKKWRETNKMSTFLKFMDEHPDWIKLHDQDVLNRIFNNDKINLPIKYNFQEGYLFKEPFFDYWKYEKEVIEARDNPVIIHYTDSKPWETNCRHPMKDIFLRYKSETLWCRTPLLTYKLKDRIFDILRYQLKKIFVFGGVLPSSSLRRYVSLK